MSASCSTMQQYKCFHLKTAVSATISATTPTAAVLLLLLLYYYCYYTTTTTTTTTILVLKLLLLLHRFQKYLKSRNKQVYQSLQKFLVFHTYNIKFWSSSKNYPMVILPVHLPYPYSSQGHKEYYQGELELNAKLRTFAVNCSLLYGGHNTVQAQLKFKGKRSKFFVIEW